MYRYIRNVDRYVAEINRTIKNEDERGLKAITVAKLYYDVGKYSCALSYLDKYDNFRTNSGHAQRLRGQVNTVITRLLMFCPYSRYYYELVSCYVVLK